MNVDQIRARFSSLDDGFAYFDAPGGTQVPDEVGQAVADAMRDASGNLGAPYATGRAVEGILERAKVDAGRFLGCSPDEISFGMNMTTLDFALSRAAGRDFAAGDEVLTTQLDHDGGVAPWVELAADRGMEVRIAQATDELTVDYDDLERQLSDRTRVVAFALASNATGTIADAKRICALAREAGAISWIDAVHYAAHEPIDVAEIGCDVLLCSPYKFCGPHLGISFVRRELAESWRPYKARPSAATPGRPEVRDGHTAVRAARGLQRDDRVPRLDRRAARDPRVRARARRPPDREPAGERRAVRPADDGGPRADVPLQRVGRPGRRRRAPPGRAGDRRLVRRQLVLRRPRPDACRSSRCGPAWRTTTRAAEVDRLLEALAAL